MWSCASPRLCAQADRELQQYKRDVQGRMLVERMHSSDDEGSVRRSRKPSEDRQAA